MRIGIITIVSIAISGCMPVQTVRASERVAQESRCSLPQGWEAVAARDPEFIVFGEMHGTREVPAFFSSLACGLARKGERLLIAIEFSRYHNGALQSAWNADGAQFEALLLKAGWRGRRDGVGSEAMFVMLRDLHHLRMQGYSIDITAFNGPAADEQQQARFADLLGQGPHEAVQAENIAIAARAGSYDRVLVLVGSLHAMKQPHNVGSGLFDPMARRLEAYGSVLSLDMKHAGGTSWNLQRDFGVHAATATGSFGRAPFIALHDKAGARRKKGGEWRQEYFDGFFWIGRISASPPKAPDYE